ncbi:MAG: OmpA family protein [Bdellovibrionota bacterium]
MKCLTRNPLILLAALLSFFLPSRIHAFDVQLFRPKVQYDRFFSTPQSTESNLPPWVFGLTANYVQNPLEFEIIGSDKKVDDLVNSFLTFNLQLSYRPSSRWVLSADLPLNFLSDIEPPQSSSSTASQSVGDLLLQASYLLRSYTDQNGVSQWALTVAPFVLIPSGTQKDFFGESNVAGGLAITASRNVFQNGRVSFSVAPHIRENETLLNLKIGSSLKTSVGYSHTLFSNRYEIYGELFGFTMFKNFYSDESTSPYEVVLGLKKRFVDKPWMFTVGAGRGLNNGYGAPDYRLFAGVGYIPGRHKKNPSPPARSQEPAIPESVATAAATPPTFPTVYFDLDHPSWQEIFAKTLQEVKAILEENPSIESVAVIGHTDSLGSDTYNMILSKKRAENVAHFLRELGVDPSRLQVEYYGESRPIHDNETPEGRLMNRRVEFEVR